MLGDSRAGGSMECSTWWQEAAREPDVGASRSPLPWQGLPGSGPAVGSGDEGTWPSPSTKLVAGTAAPGQEMLFAAAFAPVEGIQAMQLELLMGAKALHPAAGKEGGPSSPPASEQAGNPGDGSVLVQKRGALCCGPAANTGAVRAGRAGSRRAQRPPLFAEKCSASACLLAPASLCGPFLLLCHGGWKEEKQEVVLEGQLCRGSGD